MGVVPAELVVLLDEHSRPCGTMPKDRVHTTQTPLHLAFSSYVLDRRGRLLVTRRALGKRTWPGVWTNTCCGHPGPDEDPAEAVARRLGAELGLSVDGTTAVLPDFAYRATAADGIVENEVCPVFLAVADADPEPDPAEVADWRWVAWQSYVDLVGTAPWALSPWSVLQVEQLSALASQPADLLAHA